MRIASMDAINAVFERNPLTITEAKEAGQKIVGTYCIYTPPEIFMAAGAVSVSLCGTRQDTILPAEAVLPRTLCPLIKSSYGYLLTDSCPYMAAADLIVSETTCDGKKKMFELLGQSKKMYVMHMPQEQTGSAFAFWAGEYERLADFLEVEFSVTITRDTLYEAIDLRNRNRLALKRVLDIPRHVPSPVRGLQLLEVAHRTAFFPDKEEGIALLDAVHEELEALAAKGYSPYSADTPRILYTGVPAGMGAHKVLRLIEECGGNLVCIDNCTVYRKTRPMVPAHPEDSREELLYSLAQTYLNLPCSVMSPNPGRYETLRELCLAFSVDGVIDLTWQGCHTYDVEAYSVKKFVNEELGLPALHLVSDYSENDTEQIRTRIDAFLEIVRARKRAPGV